MNMPTHIAAGACLALALTRSVRRHPESPVGVGLFAVGAVALGLAAHFLLDLLPHYAWVVYLDWFKPLPFHWLAREAALGLAVAIPAFLLAGRSWLYVGCGMFGAIYPDVEKVLAVDLHVPSGVILFGWHSSELSTRTAGLPKAFLIGIESLLIVGFLFAMWRMKKAAANKGA
jgi:hypothetical protein